MSVEAHRVPAGPGGITSDFDRDGYALVPGFVREADVASLRVRLTELLSGTDAIGMPLQRLVRRVVERDNLFAQVGVRTDLIQLLTSIFGIIPRLVSSYGHEKPAGTAAHTAPHSDVAHLSGVPHAKSLLMVKAVVALTEVRPDSGPTLLYPGSHRGHDCVAPRPALMAPGDLLLFHANIRHTATANTSAHPRLGVWFVFAQPWMRQFAGDQLSSDFLAGQLARIAARPDLRHVYGLADPYATAA